MARNLTPPTNFLKNSRTLCFLIKSSKKSENTPNYAIGRIGQKIRFCRTPKIIPAALNRLIGGRRASRGADMKLFLKVISQAFLLCTRIYIFEKNIFWSQVKSRSVSMFSFQTAQIITFRWTFLIFDGFWIFSTGQLPDFQKPFLKCLQLPFMPPLSTVLDHVFLDGLGHEAPLDSLLKFWTRKKFASEIPLHESYK